MKKNKLDIAKNLLSSGELVIFPTETVFGLGADATNDEAVKSIFKVKKRPRVNPIICHFKSCLLYTSPSPRDTTASRMPSSA